jgi:hypothetical protein
MGATPKLWLVTETIKHGETEESPFRFTYGSEARKSWQPIHERQSNGWNQDATDSNFAAMERLKKESGQGPVPHSPASFSHIVRLL